MPSNMIQTSGCDRLAACPASQGTQEAMVRITSSREREVCERMCGSTLYCSSVSQGGVVKLREASTRWMEGEHQLTVTPFSAPSSDA
jgi:hypothetical protein